MIILSSSFLLHLHIYENLVHFVDLHCDSTGELETSAGIAS